MLNERAVEFEAVIEWRRAGKWFVPDVAVRRRDAIQDPYAQLPIYLCVETFSPGERLGGMLAKGEACHGWGVPYFGVVGPETRQAWSYTEDGASKEVLADGELTAGEIAIPMFELFSVF